MLFILFSPTKNFNFWFQKKLLNWTYRCVSAFSNFWQKSLIKTLRISTVAMLATKVRLGVYYSIDSIHSSFEYLFLWISFFENQQNFEKIGSKTYLFQFNTICSQRKWMENRTATGNDTWRMGLGAQLEDRVPKFWKFLWKSKKDKEYIGRGWL